MDIKRFYRHPLFMGLAVGVLMIGVIAVVFFLLMQPKPGSAPVTVTPAVTFEVVTLADEVEATATQPPATLTPAPSPPPSITPTPEPTELAVTGVITYEVEAGDTLSEIAFSHDLPVGTLVDFNGIEGEIIYPGQVLSIPVLAATPVVTATTASDQLTHIVEAGEVLGIIAELYDVTVAELVTANDLASPDAILVGQELIIPISTTQIITDTVDESELPTVTSTPDPTPVSAAPTERNLEILSCNLDDT